ncbi:MAG: efflux RND transporter permease subunit [Pirellulaceae bacterium]
MSTTSSNPGSVEPANSHFMGRLAERFYSDRRLIILTVLLATAAGLSSLAILPRMEDPQLTQRAANVVTLFPGANAEKVEALVTEKIEEALLDVPEIKRLRSQSRAGSSFLAIELRDDIYDTAPVWSELRGKIEDSIASLPQGASRPIFEELEIAAYAWIGAVVWDRDDEEASGVIRRLARDLKDRFFVLDGTKSVDLYGDPLEEIVVEIDPAKAAAAGLSPEAIARQLATADVKSSAGTLRGEHADLVIEIGNEFESLEDIRSASLQTSRPGQTLSLLEVANVRRLTPSPPPSRVLVDGKPGVVVSVLLRPDYRIDQWALQAEEVVERFGSELPPGLKLDVIMEQEGYVSERMGSLARNLILGVAAVAVMTLIFMGWRSALLVTATLPVASLMVVAGMRFLGIPIHQMSVTGLILALGLMIDNAIIATDEIQLSLKRGLSPKAAVGDMVKRLFSPLLASTVTTALAFAPIALMEGPAGEFVGAIAITVMLAIFSSLFLAMTVLPATAAILQGGVEHEGLPENSQDSAAGSNSAGKSKKRGFVSRLLLHGVQVDAITALYRGGLTRMLRYPVFGVALGCILPIAGFLAATQLNEQFFPPADRDQFNLEMELEPQSSIWETEQLAKRVEERLREFERIRGVSWFMGESAPPFYYNVVKRRSNSPNYAQAIVTLDSNENARDLIRDVQSALDGEFPRARILVRQLEQGPPFDAPVEIRLLGTDVEQLAQLGDELRSVATALPDVLHSRTMLSEIRPVVSVNVDSQVAGWTGLSEQAVAQQLFARFEGLLAGSVIEGVEEVPVRVRIAAQSRNRFEDVGDTGLMVSAETQALPAVASSQQNLALTQFTPLKGIAEIDYEAQRAVITRYNGQRSNEVQTYITAGTLPSKVLGTFNEKLEASGFVDRLPPGYRIEVGGEASERDAAVSRLMANVSVLAVGMVGALVLSLASFRLAGLIGLVATLSIGLGMGALWIFGYPFGFMAIVGTMGLIGIAINDSIVVVAALKSNEGVMRGELSETVETVIEVTRHVLATTGTTVVGFLPLVLSGGGFWPPLAVAIGTGVVGATLISVTLVPSMFRLMAPRRESAGAAA